MEQADTWQRGPQDGTWEVVVDLEVVEVDLEVDFPAVAAGLAAAGVAGAGDRESALSLGIY